jgi:hypothetical protein
MMCPSIAHHWFYLRFGTTMDVAAGETVGGAGIGKGAGRRMGMGPKPASATRITMTISTSISTSFKDLPQMKDVAAGRHRKPITSLDASVRGGNASFITLCVEFLAEKKEAGKHRLARQQQQVHALPSALPTSALPPPSVAQLMIVTPYVNKRMARQESVAATKKAQTQVANVAALAVAKNKKQHQDLPKRPPYNTIIRNT